MESPYSRYTAAMARAELRRPEPGLTSEEEEMLVERRRKRDLLASLAPPPEPRSGKTEPLKEEGGFDLRTTMQQKEMDTGDEDRMMTLQDRLISLQAAQNKNNSWYKDRDGRALREGDGVDRSPYINDISKTLEKMRRQKSEKELALNKAGQPYGRRIG